MQKKLIFLIVFMVLIAVFALQNSVEVEIKFWFWSLRTSMVLVLILTFATGAVAGILFSLPGRKKDSIKQEEKTEPVSPDATEPVEPSAGEEKDHRKWDEFEDVGR